MLEATSKKQSGKKSRVILYCQTNEKMESKNIKIKERQVKQLRKPFENLEEKSSST